MGNVKLCAREEIKYGVTVSFLLEVLELMIVSREIDGGGVGEWRGHKL